MQQYTRLETSVGVFVAVGALALAYLSITLGGLQIGGTKNYPVIARFSSVGGLKVGDAVKVAGVSVGEVAAIKLVDFAAEAQLDVQQDLKLPEDTIASVQSAGLLGDVYVSLSPGASEKDLPSGGRIQQTEPAVSLTELIGKYAFGSPVGEEKAGANEKPANTDGTTEKKPFSDPLE
jgi:phospholipid/cholesterol/gamma-HCH transport system substrate-binding protein